jgi:hypothetical protein
MTAQPTAPARTPTTGTLDDYPVDVATVAQDVPVAVKAVVIHQPEQWPDGPYCRNEHVRWPCRLYRWGADVLALAGWTQPQITDLLRRAQTGQVPWS